MDCQYCLCAVGGSAKYEVIVDYQGELATGTSIIKYSTILLRFVKCTPPVHVLNTESPAGSAVGEGGEACRTLCI